MGAARQHNPQHFPNVRTGLASFYTSDPHGCAHQTGTKLSCRAGRQQRVSVLVLARGGRPARRQDLTWGRTRSPRRPPPDARRTPCGRAGPRPLAARPLVTLILIRFGSRLFDILKLPGLSRCGAGHSAPALPRPGAEAGDAGRHRRPGPAADHRPATADAGALAPPASRCFPRTPTNAGRWQAGQQHLRGRAQEAGR